MFHFKLILTFPWLNRFDIVWFKVLPLTINKSLELQLSKTNQLLSVEFDATMQRDHAGVSLWLGLLGFAFSVEIYDNRHWDRINNCWQTEK